MAQLSKFLIQNRTRLRKQAQAVTGPIEQKSLPDRWAASGIDWARRNLGELRPDLEAKAQQIVPIKNQQRELQAKAPQMPAGTPSTGAEREAAVATEKWTQQPSDMSGAKGISKNIPNVRRYMQMMSEKGWDEAKIKEGMAPEFAAAGFFGSQEKADEVKRTVDFLVKNPAVARNYNIDPQSEAFAAATVGLGNVDQSVRQARGEELGKRLGLSGSADWMVNLADWGNKNKNWLIPAGAAVAGLGLGAYLMGGDDTDQAVQQRDPRTAMVPKWQVGDKYV